MSFDPATGEVGLSSEALRAGFTVTITAQSVGSNEAQSFKLRLAAEPKAEAPVLLTAPVLQGSGLVGEALEVMPGTWSGQPVPAITLQWLRGDVEIESETGAVYMTQAADDGQRITCRVTATNDAGALSAEPEPVRVVRAAPVAVDVLADVRVEKGADLVTVAAAAAFAGEGLSFSVEGGGAAIDSVTGLLTLPTDVARDGETVTVTATNSGGAAEASFLLTVFVIDVPAVPPAVITAPALQGAPMIGSMLTVEPGLWSGLPLPLLALQWLRDGAEIDGATAPFYVPIPADDRCALSCRVTAANKAGSVAVETAALAVTYAAPTRVGALLDEIFDQGSGLESIETAQVFAGENLSFAVMGVGATIDPVTGVLTISTETALSGEVTVSASNSGGTITASFRVTVEATGPAAPGYINPDLVEFKGVPAADGGIIYSSAFGASIQLARTVLKAGITVPKSYELLLIRSLTENPSLSFAVNIRTLPGLESYDGSADATWDSSNGGKHGVTQYLYLYWRELASGTVTEALEVPAKFDSQVTMQAPENTPTFPTANQTLTAATQKALIAALDARISAGSTEAWIIDLPSGNYGNLNLGGRQLPGKTILRSQNQSLGAKFSGIIMDGCRNITFQLVDVDRTIGSAGNYGVRMSPANDCGIEYSRIYLGGITPAAQHGWVQNVNYGIEINNVGENRSNRIRIHMNLISGPASKHIYVNGAFDSEISDNIGENVGGDFIHMGWGSRVSFLRNWGPRAYYPAWNASTGWDHNDFIQVNSQSVTGQGLIYHGNVSMGGPNGANYLPWQGIFASKSYGSGWEYQDNIICSNSFHGITAGSNMSDMRARRNTVLRCIDMPGDQHTVQYSVNGPVEMVFNVQCAYGGNTSMGAKGLNIVMTNTDHTASLAYYTAPYMGSSFYDLRPVTGKATHWDFSAGTPVGAYQRFRDVIENGAYPKIGPAATAWKIWYNSKNQITA